MSRRTTQRVRTPALDLWRRELAAGLRGDRTFDALWRAACCEAHALDFAQTPEIAESFLQDARAIVEHAAQGAE